jgi:tetratricopeptide (TPR) repeat protein
MLAETKVQAIAVVGRLAEKLTPQIYLERRQNASLETARIADSGHGDFRESANHYYSLTMSDDPEVLAEGKIGLAQQLINLGAFSQARRLLEAYDISKEIMRFQRPGILLQRAKVQEKLGWIADYEMGFAEAKMHFNNAADFLLESWEGNLANRPDDQRKVYSTTKHFSGRANYALAAMGVNRTDNVNNAIENFQEAQDLDHGIEDEHKEGKLGFGDSWIARCYMLVGDLQWAGIYIRSAQSHFENQLIATPTRTDFLAHGHLLKGYWDLKGGLPTARSHFEEALRLRQETGTYPKGLVDAYLALAFNDLKDYQLLSFLRNITVAFRTQPYTVLRGITIGA